LSCLAISTLPYCALLWFAIRMLRVKIFGLARKIVGELTRINYIDL
jgi:hypothetical protein